MHTQVPVSSDNTCEEWNRDTIEALQSELKDLKLELQLARAEVEDLYEAVKFWKGILREL